MGISAEFGYLGKYFGIAGVGISFLFNQGTWNFHLGTKGSATTCEMREPPGMGCKPNPVDMRVMIGNIRLLQPVFKVQVWRFMFSIQAGFELRLGQLWEPITNSTYDGGGFMVMDIVIGGRVGARFYFVDGLFLFAQYHFAQPIASPLGNDPKEMDGRPITWPSSGTNGFTTGMGYAF
jgi:hypothetical protein